MLAARVRVLGPDHPSTLTTRQPDRRWRWPPGGITRGRGRIPGVLAARLRVLGPDHPDTLATRHQIAREMAERGDHAAAEAEYRDVLAAQAAGARPRPPGHAGHPAPDRPWRWPSEGITPRRGRFRDVLAAQLRVLGPDHPDTLATRHQIAVEMAARGDYAAAETEFRDMLAAKLQVLGPDHPSTQITFGWVDHLAG